MVSDVGAVATLLNTLAQWFFDPNGYQELSREKKLEKIHAAMLVAVETGAWPAADLLFSELKRLSTPPP